MISIESRSWKSGGHKQQAIFQENVKLARREDWPTTQRHAIEMITQRQSLSFVLHEKQLCPVVKIDPRAYFTLTVSRNGRRKDNDRTNGQQLRTANSSQN